ncbi:sodium-dependent transporter [Marinobacter fonticola]|uniref:sodium-dependent transporter n=1 Tax=Marinobacter fonticola TaxID=2603215 RepID=UPI0011E81967|nr:sodium-dependent transporter [Marinobacter fonticola]
MLGRYQTPVGAWSHRTTYFWATIGATVGLSNLWSFPHLAGENGGGVFILFYLACLLVLTLPLMLTESIIGRGARHGAVLAVDELAREAQQPSRWIWGGRLSVLAGFLVLSFYAVIGGICLAYVFYAAYGRLDGASPEKLAGLLTALVQQPENYREFMGWHAFFLMLVVATSMQGVHYGLERAFRFVMPTFVLLLLGLFVFGVRHGDVQAAADFILQMRPEQVSFNSIRMALTHAFYTLSLGTGVLIVFGAYSAPTTPLKRSVLAVALMDTLIAILAGLVIYTFVFSSLPAGADPMQGFSLVFLALPESLASMPGGQFVTTAFFVTIVLAAWSSSIALLEPAVGWLQERIASPRGWSVLVVGFAAWLLGLASLLSFNAWADIRVLGGTPYRWIELVTSTFLIPIVSVLLAFFAGWALPDRLAHRLLGRSPRLARLLWHWVIRLLLPAAILYIGIHYAIQSGTSLCNAEQPRHDENEPFWCHMSDRRDDDQREERTSPEQPRPDSAPEIELPEEMPDIVPDDQSSEDRAPGANRSGSPRQANPAGVEGDPGPSDGDMLYHSV